MAAVRGSPDPVNRVSLCFGYCSPLVQCDCNKSVLTQVLKSKDSIVPTLRVSWALKPFCLKSSPQRASFALCPYMLRFCFCVSCSVAFCYPFVYTYEERSIVGVPAAGRFRATYYCTPLVCVPKFWGRFAVWRPT